MSDTSLDEQPATAPFWREASGQRWIASSAIITLGLIAGGYLLGDGLTRAKVADRSVTVRGLAERDVTADLAIWTIAYSASATNLQEAQANVDRDTASGAPSSRSWVFRQTRLNPRAPMSRNTAMTASPILRYASA